MLAPSLRRDVLAAPHLPRSADVLEGAVPRLHVDARAVHAQALHKPMLLLYCTVLYRIMVYVMVAKVMTMKKTVNSKK